MLCLVGTVILFTISCEKQTNPEADIEAVMAVHDAFVKAYCSMDFDKYISLIAADAVWMPPGREPLNGKKAIGEYYDHFSNLEWIKADVTLDELEVFGDLAFRTATWDIVSKLKANDEETRFNAKSIQIFKKQTDGSWKVWRSIWNSNN